MSEDVRILGLSDREAWEHEHNAVGLPSQSWHYAAALQASGYEPKLAIVRCKDAGMLVPYAERAWGSAVDIATLPSLSGAWLSSESAAPLALWREYATGQRWVAGYLQLAPGCRVASLPPASRLTSQNTVFLIDPRGWTLRQSASLIIRRKVAAALKQGAIVVNDAAALRRSFRALHLATARRVGSKSRYSDATLDQWLADPETLLIGVAMGDAIEGAHLIRSSDRHAELHLVGVTERGRPLSALLHCASIERLAARGVGRYNLGGAGEEASGLYQFKSWLGAKPARLEAVQQVYDDARYAELCAAAGVAQEGDWFPSYRAPNG